MNPAVSSEAIQKLWYSPDECGNGLANKASQRAVSDRGALHQLIAILSLVAHSVLAHRPERSIVCAPHRNL